MIKLHDQKWPEGVYVGLQFPREKSPHHGGGMGESRRHALGVMTRQEVEHASLGANMRQRVNGSETGLRALSPRGGQVLRYLAL